MLKLPWKGSPWCVLTDDWQDARGVCKTCKVKCKSSQGPTLSGDHSRAVTCTKAVLKHPIIPRA